MRKKDEMEQEIANKSIKITWFVTIIALFIAGLTGYSENFRWFHDPSGYLIIANLSVVLYLFLDRFYFSRVTEKKNFSKFVGLVILLTFIMIWATMLMAR